MTLAMVLRAKAEGTPLPGAIAPGTPWADITAAGDSYEEGADLRAPASGRLGPA